MPKPRLKKSKSLLPLDEFRSYLPVNKHNLDEEIINQPVLYEKIGSRVAEASGRVATLKEKLKAIDAELDGVHRKKLEREGLRATEALVSNRVILDKRHVLAHEKYIQAVQDYEKLLAVKEAFHQRSFMVRDLAQLYIANYYSKDVLKDEDVKDIRHQRLRDARKNKSR